jgi:murein DD-endopeptidase MepM/ murein hydrolase activator NlpD
VNASSGFGRHAFAHAGLVLGVEPAIEADGRRHAASERRMLSKRWLFATVLTGAAGATLIGTAIYATLDRHAVKLQQPSYALPAREVVGADTAVPKGDRIVKKVDVVAEKQSFRAPTTITVGDKQVIRLRGYTHVAATLTLTPTAFSDQVPAFNPLRLLSGDEPDAASEAPADPGPAPETADVAFTVADMAAADPTAFTPGLTKAEVAAQVAQMVKAQSALGVRGALSLPPQLLLMRTSRAILEGRGPLAFASPGGPGAGFSSIDVKMVPENVTVVPRQEALHEAGPAEERLVVMRHGETLEDLLRATGAGKADIRAIVDAFGARPGTAPVSEGRRLRFLMTDAEDGRPGGRIARLSVYADETLESTIALDDAGRYVKVDAVAPARRATAAPAAGDEEADDAGRIRLYDSIYQTALKQQIPKPVIATMIRVLANDVDFQQAVQAGDSFDAFYSNDDDGDGRPDLLFASVTIRNEAFRYYRFEPKDESGAAEYYDDAGRSMRKFLIRTPVPNGIFTSGFGMRFHPVLGYTRPHTGVDWTAAIGTPILAAGNGTILTAERSPSYGNHIEIQHANGYVTTYSHMSGFARGISNGTRVRQGQVIGYLGQTGLATGPHLHYEVIVNSHFVDPMRVKLARSHDVDAKQMTDFRREHDRIDALMASAPNAPQDGQNRASN